MILDRRAARLHHDSGSLATVRYGVALLTILMYVLPALPAAHEIPNSVTIQMFLKPEGQRLRMIIRVPLASINDIDWPLRPNGMLDLSRAERALQDSSTQWLADFIAVYEGSTRLAYPRVVDVRASLAADRSFESYEQALAHVTGPRLPGDSDFVLNQGMLDAFFDYSIQSDQSRFSIHPDFTRLGVQTTTVLRFLPPDGSVRALELHNDPGLIRIDPRWFQAAWMFVKEGFFHILDGTDHLLFLFCLIIPFRRIRSLIPIVTSFTVAHSITLIASAYNMAPDALWFPPLIETLIATSIVYMALENMVAPGLQRRWMITFGFGLVHGFGFSFALRQTLQFAGSHLLASLLSFNVGVELGQVLVLVILVPVLVFLFRFVVAERPGTIILSALVAHTGWHWMSDRYATLRRFRFEWPLFDAAFFAMVLRWMMLGVILAAAWWLIFGLLRHRPEATKGEEVHTT